MSGISIAKSLELHLLRPRITRAEVVAGCHQAAQAHLAVEKGDKLGTVIVDCARP